VLWRCWLGGRKGIQPVKTEWWDSGIVICLRRGADLHMAQLMPLPLTTSCSSKSRLVLPSVLMPSVLWRCWLGDRKGIWPVKNWVVGCWRGYLGWGADLHIAQQMPLPLTVSCSSKSRLALPSWFLPFWYLLTRVVLDKFQKSSKTTVCVYLPGFTFLVLAHLGRPRQSPGGHKTVVV